MININLLPEDMRRPERTPVRIFIATLLAASVITGLGGTLAYLWFGKLATAEELVARLKEDREGLEPQLKHHAALESEITESKKWRQTLLELRGNKIPWGRKIDQLIDLVSQTGDQGKYLIWLDDLIIQQQLDGKQNGGTVTAKGMSDSDDVAKVMMFVTDLKRHDFFSDFATLSVPSQKVPDQGGNVVEFPMNLTLALRDVKKNVAGKDGAKANDPAPAQPEAK